MRLEKLFSHRLQHENKRLQSARQDTINVSMVDYEVIFFIIRVRKSPEKEFSPSVTSQHCAHGILAGSSWLM